MADHWVDRHIACWCSGGIPGGVLDNNGPPLISSLSIIGLRMFPWNEWRWRLFMQYIQVYISYQNVHLVLTFRSSNRVPTQHHPVRHRRNQNHDSFQSSFFTLSSNFTVHTGFLIQGAACSVFKKPNPYPRFQMPGSLSCSGESANTTSLVCILTPVMEYPNIGGTARGLFSLLRLFIRKLAAMFSTLALRQKPSLRV